MSLPLKRQLSSSDTQVANSSLDDSDYDNSWWWSNTGYAVRYAIIAAIFGLILLYLVLGYTHARRRITKGLEPLAYHRWMVRRRVSQPYNYYGPAPPGGMYYVQQDGRGAFAGGGYPMQEFPPPPPAYNSAEAPPPTYQPPEGGSKVLPDQGFTHTHREGESSGVAVPAASQR